MATTNNGYGEDVFAPKYSGYKDRVRDSFGNQRFMELIGAKLIEVQPGYCEIQLPFQPSLTQQHGFFHAGIIATIADNTAGYACFSLMGEFSSILTVEFKLNLLAPGQGELLIGTSRVLKYGKTLTVCRSDVFIVARGKRKLCASSQSTLMELKDTPDH